MTNKPPTPPKITVKEFKTIYKLAKPSLSDDAQRDELFRLHLHNGNVYATDSHILTIMGDAYKPNDNSVSILNRSELIQVNKQLRASKTKSDEVIDIFDNGDHQAENLLEALENITVKTVEKLLITLPMPKFTKEHEEISSEFDINRNGYVSKYGYIGLDFSHNDTVRYVEPNTQMNPRSSVVNVSIRYLKSILRRTKGDVTVGFAGEIAPLLFKCKGLPDLTHILMPVRPL